MPRGRRRSVVAGAQRTTTPAARSASLTCPTVSSPKWKTLAASTASAPAATAGAKCSTAAGSAAGDDGHRDGRPHAPDELEVEALLGAVGVHGVEQDLARPELGRAGAPLDGVEVDRRAPAVGRHDEVVGGPAVVADPPAHVGREHEHLGPEALGDLGDELGTCDGRRVDADLVGARAQEAVDVVDGAHSPADGERDEDLLRGAPHDVVGRLAVAAARRHVEEGQLVDALRVVDLGELDGVAGVAEVLEVDALDDAARRRRRDRR